MSADQLPTQSANCLRASAAGRRRAACRTQANAMMRQGQSALRLLLRMQAARQKLEANNEARDRAASPAMVGMGLAVTARFGHLLSRKRTSRQEGLQGYP